MSKNQSTNQLIRYICITKFTKKAGICTDFPGRIYIPTRPGQYVLNLIILLDVYIKMIAGILFLYILFFFLYFFGTPTSRRQLIISMNENLLIASANLQTHSDLMENWYIKQRFKLNHSKSIHTTFTIRPASSPEVTLTELQFHHLLQLSTLDQIKDYYDIIQIHV